MRSIPGKGHVHSNQQPIGPRKTNRQAEQNVTRDLKMIATEKRNDQHFLKKRAANRRKQTGKQKREKSLEFTPKNFDHIWSGEKV